MQHGKCNTNFITVCDILQNMTKHFQQIILPKLQRNSVEIRKRQWNSIVKQLKMLHCFEILLAGFAYFPVSVIFI
jgi:2-iminoacetate synthase ThiH